MPAPTWAPTPEQAARLKEAQVAHRAAYGEAYDAYAVVERPARQVRDRGNRAAKRAYREAKREAKRAYREATLPTKERLSGLFDASDRAAMECDAITDEIRRTS